MRDEWAKIQGRFVDLAISGRRQTSSWRSSVSAIESDGKYRVKYRALDSRNGSPPVLTARIPPRRLLEGCWPLHPSRRLALLGSHLAAAVRRRTSAASSAFLNSTEPRGLPGFSPELPHDGELYAPDRLVWDYLRVNLEPSILASPDGHRWALAVDARRAPTRPQAPGSCTSKSAF